MLIRNDDCPVGPCVVRGRGVLKQVAGFAAAVFLLGNVAARSYAVYGFGLKTTAVLTTVFVLLILVRLFPGLLQYLCLLLGLTLPLFGFQSYTLYNQAFELCVATLGCLLLFGRGGFGLFDAPGRLAGMTAGYVLLALFSLLLLPLASFYDTLLLWGPFDFANRVFFATPNDPFYSLAAGNRLLVFFLTVVLLSRHSAAPKLFRNIFAGSAAGLIIACLLGLLDLFGVFSLAWYRPRFIDGSGVDRLHSVFGNPGWFAEYAVVSIPLVFLLLDRVKSSRMRLAGLSAVLVLAGASLVFTGSRTSWLVFMVALVFCYLAARLRVPGSEERPVAWRELRGSCIKAGAGALALGVIGGLLFLAASRTSPAVKQGQTMSKKQYIAQRMKNIAAPQARGRIWADSMALLGESPAYGLGYEAYRWHSGVMGSIPDSRYARQRTTKVDWDTPHNMYLQLIAGNGWAGLLVWLMLAGYTALMLCRDIAANRGLLSTVLLGALVLFHLYGLTQAMQYVASIWFMAFLIIGYGMLLERKPLASSLARFGNLGVAAALAVALIGGAAYAGNFQSARLAERYGLSEYALDRGVERYKGFYNRENWGRDGNFRWSGRQSEIVLSRPGRVRFDIACFAPGLERRPLTLEVSLNGKPLDSHTFSKAGKITQTYDVPPGDGQGENILRFRVSRVWNPRREGLNSDARILGVAVSAPRYLKPEDRSRKRR